LDTIAKRVIHTGAIGTGSIAKIMHNCASFTLDMLIAECWTTGVKAGIDAATIVRVFNEAALGQMMSLKVRLPATYLRGDFDPRRVGARIHPREEPFPVECVIAAIGAVGPACAGRQFRPGVASDGHHPPLGGKRDPPHALPAIGAR